jgi:hemerythrin superfamily protein
MDAIQFLTNDHREARKVMQEICDIPAGSASRRKSLFESLKKDLLVHDNIEETLFYPAVKSRGKEFLLVDHEAHQVVENLLDELSELSIEDETWLPKFKVMRGCLLSHVQEEETDYFPKIQKILKGDELASLGDKMQKEKEKELQAL